MIAGQSCASVSDGMLTIIVILTYTWTFCVLKFIFVLRLAEWLAEPGAKPGRDGAWILNPVNWAFTSFTAAFIGSVVFYVIMWVLWLWSTWLAESTTTGGM